MTTRKKYLPLNFGLESIKLLLISSFTLVWVHASESFGSSLFGKNETIWRGPEYISNLFLLIFFTKKDAKDLATSLLSTLAKQGILKGGLAILSHALATSLTKVILSKSIQSVTAVWLIRIVGLSLIEYFKNGQDWGDGGIQEVVDKIYRISKREDILNNFVREAISKIEMKKYFKSNKSLPPFTM